jgi:hypothetical protein
MGVYQSGTAVTITETFTILGVPTNPTTVTFTVVSPDPGVADEVFVFGVDPEVTNPSAGVFVLSLPIQTYPGVYHYKVAGTGAVVASGEGEFTILQSSVSPTDTVLPEFGPCTTWIDCGDIRAQCNAEGDDELLDGIAAMASQLMFEISGRQFTGRCERTVRPCDPLSTCWTNFSGYNNWIGWPWAWGWDSFTWGWYDQMGCRCSCTPLSRVMLPGYPVTEIVEVKIDGVAVAADTYRLDEYQFLTRMRDPAEPDIPLFWPACQILDLDDDVQGTWSVRYFSGVDPPLAGKAAAAALACELLPGADCKLPTGAVRIVRQGVTIDRLQPLARMLLEGMTGIPAIDTFIAAYNPSRLRRRPAIWSASGPKFARPMGNG